MSTAADRVELLLRVTTTSSPADLMSWRIDGRPPTSDELRLLRSVTLTDAETVRALHDLDVELDRTFNEHRGDG